MVRLLGIFLLTVLICLIIFIYIIPLLLGGSVGEFDIVVGLLLILIGSFIITQVFYIIDLIKNIKDN
ncbi:hypothetical protein AB1L07_21470 [Niallia alba]|uniref:hypothetical protein n=1 Tax=Niallia alba TaxID=2729105 RepID=UPI0039A368CC